MLRIRLARKFLALRKTSKCALSLFGLMIRDSYPVSFMPMEHVTQTDLDRKARLMKGLDGFLERDRDREVVRPAPKGNYPWVSCVGLLVKPKYTN